MMKGFLSLLGITLIAVFCGLILLTFYEPFDEWQNRERLQAYTETRDNTIQVGSAGQSKAFPQPAQTVAAFADRSASCPAP